MSDAMITRRGGGGGGSRLQSKTVSITGASTNVAPDSGYDGMSSVTVNIAAESQKAAETFTPGTQAQTIAANQWLAGAQTIQGDANLLATNIKKGVSIFNVAGSYEASGLDTDSAVLKVVTSTGCSVSVTNGTNTFTQQDADGFVRTGDANVTEHFFVIPTAAFGTFSVTSTHPTYGNNTKTNAVVIGNAGKVYEVLCGGKNIILNSTFGLQEGFSISGNYYTYNDRDKRIEGPDNASVTADLSPAVSVAPYEYMTVSFSSVSSSYNASMYLRDSERALVSFEHQSVSITQQTKAITNKYDPTATIRIGNRVKYITEIILT
jgi:hypothetical protein